MRSPASDRWSPDVSEVQSGLEGVVAFATEIAEPDREGGALRYRGVDIEDLVGSVPYEKVWGLLVDGIVRAGPQPRRATSAAGALGRPARRRAVRARDARARVGIRPAARHQRRAGAHRPRARVGHGALVRRPVGARARTAVGAAGGGRRGHDDRRALPDPLARRGRSRPRQGDRCLLDLRGRARHERLDLHCARDRLDRRRCRGGDVGRRRRAQRAAARRCAGARAADDLRGRGQRRRRGLGRRRARPRRAPDGLRPPRLPRRGPARACAAAHGARARIAALRGRGGAGAAPRSPSSPRASPTACSRPMSSSGRPWCSTLPRSRRSSSRACSRAHASPAGRRTSSSRSARAA